LYLCLLPLLLLLLFELPGAAATVRSVANLPATKSAADLPLLDAFYDMYVRA
jgi:hypothetical protein